MQKPLLKQIISLAGLILTGLVSLAGVPDAQIPNITIGQWNVFPSLYSIGITHNQNPEDFCKVSPDDDVIFYEDGSWDKVIRGDEQILNDSLISPSFYDRKIIRPLQKLLKKPQVSFVSITKGISYQAYRDEDKLIIKKVLNNLPKKAIGFGNAFVFSEDDEIFDTAGKHYLLPELREDRTEISGINGLIFRHPKSTGRIFLPLEPEQKVIIDRIYRVVEVKVEFPKAVGEVKVEQEVWFE
ncbi:MAG: hypothetical protein FJ044_02285 [Candidatus Cloacimonetes bacterium]|nr:hypothetical protein [Candidatus Cloacimonadota bacterium]